MPENLTSPANPLLKEVRKAAGRGSLTASGLCLAEGTNLLEEALRSPLHVETLLISESAEGRAQPYLARLKNARIAVLPDAAFAAIATTEKTQGIMALIRPRVWKPASLFSGVPLVVVLDGVQDPGNAGAVVRAAEAFGATGVIFAKGTVSPHNPRTLRASAGSLFRLPYLLATEPDEITALLQEHGCTCYAAMPWGPGVPSAAEAILTQPTAFIIGGEGRGIGAAMQAVATPISIPTRQVESLNASVAAAVLLYEVSRQRGPA